MQAFYHPRSSFFLLTLPILLLSACGGTGPSSGKGTSKGERSIRVNLQGKKDKSITEFRFKNKSYKVLQKPEKSLPATERLVRGRTGGRIDFGLQHVQRSKNRAFFLRGVSPAKLEALMPPDLLAASEYGMKKAEPQWTRKTRDSIKQRELIQKKSKVTTNKAPLHLMMTYVKDPDSTPWLFYISYTEPKHRAELFGILHKALQKALEEEKNKE